MAPEELHATLHTQPFRPFRIVMTDGQTYEVPHPEFLMVGRRSAVVGRVQGPDQKYYDTPHIVDLLHVMRIERLEHAAKSPQNGDT